MLYKPVVVGDTVRDRNGDEWIILDVNKHSGIAKYSRYLSDGEGYDSFIAVFSTDTFGKKVPEYYNKYMTLVE